jgi:nucleotide-binding universal stress UspA family protein
MIALKKILFPTDFSENSKAAQEYAAAFAEQFQAELHVIHVLVDITMMPEPGSALTLPQNYLLDMKQEAERALDKMFPDAAQKGRKIVRAFRMGSPYVEIVTYAQENQIDLIILGTHGRGAIAHMLLGSIAEKVVRKAPCPVLTVRPAGHQFIAP